MAGKNSKLNVKKLFPNLYRKKLILMKTSADLKKKKEEMSYVHHFMDKGNKSS